MSKAGGVEVDLRSLKAAWKRADYGQFWIRFRTSATADDDVRQVLEDLDTEQGPDGIWTSGGAKTPIGYLIQVDAIPDDAEFAAWMTDLGFRLELAGLTGRLQGIISKRPPVWFTTSIVPDSSPPQALPPIPSAFLAWDFDFTLLIDRPERDSTWFVDPKVTAHITDAFTEWTRRGGPNAILSDGLFGLEVPNDATVADALTNTILRVNWGRLTCFGTEQDGGREAAFGPNAGTTLTISRHPSPWRDRIDEYRQALLALPGLLTQGFVRPASPGLTTWTEIGDRLRLPHEMHERFVRYNGHLLPHYAVDAHAIQVLQDSHLAKARDLTAWNITDLGHGRHLVEAPDLDPWFGEPLPDADTLAKARHDFGPMLLTEQIVADNPPPWEHRPS